VRLEDDRLDPLARKELRKRQSRRPRADDADLRSQFASGL
jgi:hypothetical protein